MPGSRRLLRCSWQGSDLATCKVLLIWRRCVMAMPGLFGAGMSFCRGLRSARCARLLRSVLSANARSDTGSSRPFARGRACRWFGIDKTAVRRRQGLLPAPSGIWPIFHNDGCVLRAVANDGNAIRRWVLPVADSAPRAVQCRPSIGPLICFSAFQHASFSSASVAPRCQEQLGLRSRFPGGRFVYFQTAQNPLAFVTGAEHLDQEFHRRLPRWPTAEKRKPKRLVPIG